MPSQLKTPQWFPICRQIMHHTQCKKRSNIAAPVSWCGFICESKSEVINISFAHYTILRHTTSKEMTNLFLIYSHIINRAKNNNKGRCDNVPSRQKNKKFFNFCCEQVINIMMHTEKTPSVTCRTLIIFLFGAVSRKQHTIGIIFVWFLCLIFHEICFNSVMNNFKEIFAIS